MAMLNPQKVMKKMFYLCERARKKEREIFFTPLQWCAFIACAVGRDAFIVHVAAAAAAACMHLAREKKERKIVHSF
jgi:hypothetical protein